MNSHAKRSRIKQITAASLLALTASLLDPAPRAEAGVILTAGGASAITYIFTGRNVNDGDLGIWYLGLLGAGSGIALTVIGACTGNIPLLVLDSDGKQGIVEARLSHEFPFLADQPEVISNLADHFKASAKKAAENSDPSATSIVVRLPESEIESVLENAILTPAQSEKVVQRLK